MSPYKQFYPKIKKNCLKFCRDFEATLPIGEEGTVRMEGKELASQKRDFQHK